MYDHTAAQGARTLLHGAAQRLRTADPVPELGHALDAALSRPAGDAAYRTRPTLEPRFSEAAAGTLAFDLLPGGPWATPTDRVSAATSTVRHMTGRNFGREAVRWLDGRLEVAGALTGRSSAWGASLGSGFGRDGVIESAVHLEWGPQLMDSLPAPLHRVTQIVLETVPGLRPAFSTVRTTRHGGSQQVTFAVPRALPLDRLAPLMGRLGIGQQHAGLVSTVALLLGARYTLPPDAGMITVRIGRNGVEFRLDVNLDAIPDPPPEIARLLALQMSERPRSLRAFRRWVAALTPDGYDGPGRLSVLSVVVSPQMPARLVLHLCPGVVEQPRHHEHPPHHSPPPHEPHRWDDGWAAPRDDVPASAWLPAGAAP